MSSGRHADLAQGVGPAAGLDLRAVPGRGDAEPLGHLAGVRAPDVADQLGEHGVDRVPGGVAQVAGAAALALVVADRARVGRRRLAARDDEHAAAPDTPWSAGSPLAKAVASTNGFHAEPGWRPAAAAGDASCRSSRWPRTSTVTLAAGGGSQPPRARLTSAYGPWPNSRPPTRACTNPVWGSTDASAISSGSAVPLSAFWTDWSAASWMRGSRVVWTRRPPLKTQVGPELG